MVKATDDCSLRFTEEQLISMLNEQDAGAAKADVRHKRGVSSARQLN
ncbi:hypothetical protein [Bosea sp. UNC402CLCol]|nr:hypothetical protein [Bosea sp. UNC402CLCol]